MIATAWQCYSMHRYVTRVNRKLSLFLESIRYSDFSIRFSADNKMGSSFRQLNVQFNEVLQAFREARAEKEANLKYIDIIIQQISIGILSFDSSGKVELINPATYRLLGISRLRNISQLQTTHAELADLLWKIPSGGKALYHMTDEHQLAVNATGLRLQGKLVKLVSIQNIYTELQQKELDAWQNLTKTLRHEIMNSFTPIVSLIGTMKDIVENDLGSGQLPEEPAEDLKSALYTIENRSKGIMNFVNAYRDYTTLPQPAFSMVKIDELFLSVGALMEPELKKKGIRLIRENLQPELSINADAEQLQMVLINLIRNAGDVMEKTEDPVIHLKARQQKQYILIEVVDNGPGIDPEIQEKVFIPFYTTKKTGSGIGLPLSRQIIQLHGGQLRLISAPGKGSTLRIVLNP